MEWLARWVEHVKRSRIKQHSRRKLFCTKLKLLSRGIRIVPEYSHTQYAEPTALRLKTATVALVEQDNRCYRVFDNIHDLPGVPYVLKRADGPGVEGVLDAYGRMARLYTDNPEEVTFLVGGMWEILEGVEFYPNRLTNEFTNEMSIIISVATIR